METLLCIPERQEGGGNGGFFSGRLSFPREFCPLKDINQSWITWPSCGVLEDEPGWGLWKWPYEKEISPATSVLSKLLKVLKFPFVWLNKCVLFSHFQSSVGLVDKLCEQKLHVPVPFVMYKFWVQALLLWLSLGFMTVFVQLTDCSAFCVWLCSLLEYSGEQCSALGVSSSSPQLIHRACWSNQLLHI